MDDRARDMRVRDRRRPGWFHVDNIIVDQYGPLIGAHALAVYTALCRRASSEESAIVTVRNLAKVTATSPSTVRRAIKRLVDTGLVSIEYRFDGPTQFANEYVILEPANLATDRFARGASTLASAASDPSSPDSSTSALASAATDSRSDSPTTTPPAAAMVSGGVDLGAAENHGTTNRAQAGAIDDRHSHGVSHRQGGVSHRQGGVSQENGGGVTQTAFKKDLNPKDKDKGLTFSNRLALELIEVIERHGPRMAVELGEVTPEQLNELESVGLYRRKIEQARARKEPRWIPH